MQSCASFVAEAGVKKFVSPDVTLTFQQHKDLIYKQFKEFAAYVKTHGLDRTEKLLDHLHANKLVHFIHQAARHTDMAADVKTLYGATLEDIVENLALKPSPATTERLQSMFTSLLTKLKTHRVSGTIPAAPVKSDPSFTKTALRQVSDEHHKRPERLLARGSDGSSGGDARGGGRGKGSGAKTTVPKFKPAKGTPGKKVFIADNDTVCESCDSHGHFARDCPHRKPNAVAAQKKHDAEWAEKNKAQTRELKEIDKLNKEIGRLRVLAAESAGAVGSEEEDWTSGEDTRAARSAVNRKHYFLSSPPCVNPPKSYLLAAVPPLSCISDTRDKIVIRKTVYFLISTVALVCANAPTRFWPDATIDFPYKKNTLWAKRDEHGDLSTANNRMQPAFAGSYGTVAIPFGSRDRICTSRTSFGQERILRRSFC